MKAVKALLWLVSVLLVLLVVVGTVAGNYFYNLALNPHFDKTRVLEAEHNEVDYDSMQESFDEGREWFKESGYTQEWLESFDGLMLSAYMVLNGDVTGRWVVICHGYSSAAYYMVGFARQFYEWGYNVLMLDARGCGNSEGDYIGMGWHDRLDLLGWVEWLNGAYAPENIVLYGVSMGGGTVMMASGEDLPENVRAIVEDSGYSSAWEEFGYQLKSLFGLPAFPLMHFTSLITRVRAGYWLGQADAVAQVAKSQTPILFIHGEEDDFVPAYMLDMVYDAAGCEKERLLMAGAGHVGGFSTDAQLYWGTIYAFVERYIV